MAMSLLITINVRQCVGCFSEMREDRNILGSIKQTKCSVEGKV